MNPNIPRLGIELKNDTLYYCEEDINQPGKYQYYYCINNGTTFENFKKDIKKKLSVLKQRCVKCPMRHIVN